jgi:hypothetical protein
VRKLDKSLLGTVSRSGNCLVTNIIAGTRDCQSYLGTSENDFTRDENEENDFGFDHSVNETGEELDVE